MKQKLLFVLPEMNVGGVEKALLGLLSSIDLDRYDVTVSLIFKRGGLLRYIPNQIKVNVINGLNEHFRLIVDTPYQIVWRYLKRLMLLPAIKYSLKYFKSKKQKCQIPLFEFIYRRQAVDETAYDIAVAYSGPFHAMEYYLLNFVKANKRICWIHFDVSKFGINNAFVEKYYPQFDEINLVSQQAKDVFDKRFPFLTDKTKVVYNVIDKNLILSQSEEKVDDMPIGECNHVRIVTVGRVSKEKGQYDVLPYFKQAIDKGLNAKWYFVGGGSDVDRCLSEAKELGIEENVIILGVKTNPYPYMRNCDIYVQPSRHEGYCITLAEAKLFGHPIITTPFTGAEEQLSSYNFPSAIILLDLLPNKLIEYANNLGDYSDI